jgi:hypothetical protein
MQQWGYVISLNPDNKQQPLGKLSRKPYLEFEKPAVLRYESTSFFITSTALRAFYADSCEATGRFFLSAREPEPYL